MISTWLRWNWDVGRFGASATGAWLGITHGHRYQVLRRVGVWSAISGTLSLVAMWREGATSTALVAALGLAVVGGVVQTAVGEFGDRHLTTGEAILCGITMATGIVVTAFLELEPLKLWVGLSILATILVLQVARWVRRKREGTVRTGAPN
jgi:hypothetical protein